MSALSECRRDKPDRHCRGGVTRFTELARYVSIRITSPAAGSAGPEVATFPPLPRVPRSLETRMYRLSRLVHRYVRLLTTLAVCVAAGVAGAQELTVSAAASLTDAFKEIGRSFEATKPGTRRVQLRGVGALLQQIAQARPSTCSRPPTRRRWTAAVAVAARRGLARDVRGQRAGARRACGRDGGAQGAGRPRCACVQADRHRQSRVGAGRPLRPRGAGSGRPRRCAEGQADLRRLGAAGARVRGPGRGRRRVHLPHRCAGRRRQGPRRARVADEDAGDLPDRRGRRVEAAGVGARVHRPVRSAPAPVLAQFGFSAPNESTSSSLCWTPRGQSLGAARQD
jgi:hypothetical protein